MCGGGLSKLPDGRILGIITREKMGFVFHWEKLYNLDSHQIEKLLQKINCIGNTIPWAGQRDPLIKKIKYLNKKHGLPGIRANILSKAA